MSDIDWYFLLSSEEFGAEEFGPYDSCKEAMDGIGRIVEKAVNNPDGVKRSFSFPYQGKANGPKTSGLEEINADLN